MEWSVWGSAQRTSLFVRYIIWRLSIGLYLLLRSGGGEGQRANAMELPAVERDVWQRGPALLPLLRLAHDSHLRRGRSLDSVRGPDLRFRGAGVAARGTYD